MNALFDYAIFWGVEGLIVVMTF